MKSKNSNVRASSLRRNVPRLYVQAIFALAAALALTTSACGKQEGSKINPAQTKTAAKNTDAVGTVAGTNGKNKEADKLKSTPTSGLGSNTQKRGEGTVAHDGVEREPDPGDGTSKPVAVEPVQAEAPLNEVDLGVESVVYYDPSGLTPDQIFNRKAGVDLAGAFVGEQVRSDIISATGEPLFYTGSGQDNLREYLYTLVNERAAQQHEVIRAGDKKLAQTIQLSNFKVDWDSRRAELYFKLERLGSQGQVVMSRVTLQGPLDNLARFQVGSLKKAPYIAAEVACMDISGGCQTVHVRVQDASTGNIQTAHLIARHTAASLVFTGNAPGVSKNPEYDRLVSILVNTEKQPAGENVVEKLTLTTSETIGGASNFSVNMKIRLMDQYGRTGGDTIEVTGPLAKPRGNANPNIGLNVQPALTVINGEIVTTQAIGTQGRIVDTIREARLLKNDGHGNLQVELTVRNAAGESVLGAKEDRIVLTVGRIHTPTTSVRIPMQ